MAGWVYIISNKAMPDILKIGYTERTPYIRAYELYNTGCPYPYKVDYAIYVDRPYEVEQKAHELQRENNVGKEWFSCPHDVAVTTIRDAIKLLDAKCESEKTPQEPTPSEIRDIIKENPTVKENPIVAGLIETFKSNYNENLNSRIDDYLIVFNNIHQKLTFNKSLGEINKNYDNEVFRYKEEYERIISEERPSLLTSFLASMFSVYFCGGLAFFPIFLVYRLLVGCNIIKEIYISDRTILCAYILISLIFSIYIKISEDKKHIKYKSSSFEDIYDKELTKLNKHKIDAISELKSKWLNDPNIKAIKLN